MAPRKVALTELTARSQQFVDLLIRFGLLTTDAVRLWFPDLSEDAARKVLERLAEDGWLAKHRLPSGQAYFVLSSSACYRLGLKRNAVALRQRTLIRHCLVLFHFASHRHLKLLTSAECRQHLPTIYRRGAASFFFIDSQNDSLGWVCLDDGKQLLRIRTKLLQTAAKKKLLPELRQLAASDRFRFLLLTPAEAKAQQLKDYFATRPIPALRIEVAAVPACATLIL